MNELQSILHILRTTTHAVVLCTLVHIRGSSYRRVGARLLYAPKIGRFGSISGGCLEEDLLERARRVLATGVNETVVYDTTQENDLVWGVGLGCHGVVHVLVERLHGLPPALRLVTAAWEKRQPAAVASVYAAGGELPLGTALAVSTDASEPAGNAELWPLLAPEAHTVLREGASRHVELSRPGGKASVFVEYLPPPFRLRLFGAGDDAQPLVRLAKELGWQVEVTDPRSAFATSERFSEADVVRVQSPEAAGTLPWDPWTLAVVMTHHYRFDLPLLRCLLPLGLPYLGLLGPKQRAERILDGLTAEGLRITDTMRERLHAPVGLDLGSGSPEAVAFAIIAECLAVLNHRSGRPLRERTRPIHG